MTIIDFNKKMFGKTSRFTGVSWNAKSKMWQVHCYHQGKTIYIGRYYTEERAANMYNVYVIKHKLGKTLNVTRKLQKKYGVSQVVMTEERTWYNNVKVTIQTFFEDAYEKAKQIWSNTR